MKPVTTTETLAASEDKVRKFSLYELQPSATEKENLVGAHRIIKSQRTQEAKSKKNVSTKKKKNVAKKQIKVTTNDKAVQTVSEEKPEIEAEDLTCTNLSSSNENYWQILAERRRIALKDALEDNEELVKRLEKLEEEKCIYKKILDETRALVEVLQDMMEDDRNEINNSLEDNVL